jgi:hypothetical protein
MILLYRFIIASLFFCEGIQGLVKVVLRTTPERSSKAKTAIAGQGYRRNCYRYTDAS